MKTQRQFFRGTIGFRRNSVNRTGSVLFLFAILLHASLVHAQQAKVSAGTVTAFYQALKPTSNANAKTAGPVKHRATVKSGETVSLSINGSRQTASGEVFTGKVENNKSSIVYFTYKNGEIEGKVIIPEQKKAYAYSSSNGSVFVVPEDIEKVLCTQYQKEAKSPVASSSLAPPANSPIYNLQSLPGATAVVLLDYDGHDATGSWWGNIIAAPASVSETDILEAWQVVSEDFRPYQLNITTSEAVYQAAPSNKRMRCVITPTTTAAPSSGGVAFIGTFNTGGELAPCWVFNGSNGGGQVAGETASHEIGHTMTLGHDGRELPGSVHEEYYGGEGYWAPIMGVSFYAGLSHWSIGEYQYANNTEDDVTRIGTLNGFGFRTDEAGNSLLTAKHLIFTGTGDIVADSNNGIIHDRNDVDIYYFDTPGGTAVINVTSTAPFTNLDIALTLKNSAGSVISTSDPANTLDASIRIPLGAGRYYLTVDGVGKGDPFTNGYSDYSSLGQYKITGNVKLANTAPDVVLAFPTNGAVYAAPATFQLSAGATDLESPIAKVEFYQNGVKIGEDAFYPGFTWGIVNLAQGTYYFKAKAYDQGGLSTVSDSVLVIVDGTPPTVSIVAPYNNSEFTAPANFVLNASVSDTQGPIKKVEFYQDNVLLGEDIYYPSFDWYISNLIGGTYTFTAKAYDQAGLSTTSAPITIIVHPCVLNDATPTASQFVLRNGWWDQQSGSAVSNESSALKVVHRAYGENELWVLQTGKTFNVVNGITYNVQFDFKDFQTVGVSGIEVAFATGILNDNSGPVTIGPAVSFPSGYSYFNYTTKSANVPSAYTGSVFLAIKLKWASQPTAQVTNYIKDINICPGAGSTSKIALTETESIFETNANNLAISPNPSEADFSAYAKRAISTLTVSDLQGKLVYQKENIGEDSNLRFGESFNMGVYLVKVKYQDGTQESFKVVKTK